MVAAQTQMATAQLKPSMTLKRIESFQFGVKAEDVQKGAQGPSAAPIELLEGLRTEDINLNPAQLFSIATSIYPDKNPNSGVFYYHPRSYHLEWTPENGHGMRILYGAATGDGAAGHVLMATRLQSGMDASEVQIATRAAEGVPAAISRDGVHGAASAAARQGRRRTCRSAPCSGSTRFRKRRSRSPRSPTCSGRSKSHG